MTTAKIADESWDKYAALLARPKASEVAHTPETIRAEFMESHKNPNTERVYNRALKDFEEFFTGYDVELFEIDEAKMRVYLERLQDDGAGAQKINQYFAAIRGFYKTAMKFSASTGVLQNPAVDVKLPPLAKHTHSKGLTITQADRLVRAAEGIYEPEFSLKATAVVRVLLTTGIRAVELATAQAEGFDTAEDWAWLDIRRKGGAADRVRVPPSATEALKDLLDGRRTGPLILSRSGGDENVAGLERLLVRLGRDGGLDDFKDRLYPHNMRVAFATFCYAAGEPLLKIMRKMGHSKQETTARYVQLADHIPRREARRILELR